MDYSKINIFTPFYLFWSVIGLFAFVFAKWLIPVHELAQLPKHELEYLIVQSRINYLGLLALINLLLAAFAKPSTDKKYLFIQCLGAMLLAFGLILGLYGFLADSHFSFSNSSPAINASKVFFVISCLSHLPILYFKIRDNFGNKA
jgi:hypothetical protein